MKSENQKAARIANIFGLAAVLGGLSFGFVNMTPVPVPISIVTAGNSELSSETGLCQTRPSTSATPIYDSIVKKRQLGSMSDADVLTHASRRFGFSLSPFGSVVPARANDCTTVFVAEELASPDLRPVATFRKNFDIDESSSCLNSSVASS